MGLLKFISHYLFLTHLYGHILKKKNNFTIKRLGSLLIKKTGTMKESFQPFFFNLVPLIIYKMQAVLNEISWCYIIIKKVSIWMTPRFKSLVKKSLFILIVYSWPLSDEVMWPNMWEKVQYIIKTKTTLGKGNGPNN